MMTPAEQFGNIDIYLFDQILRGRIAPGMTVFDAGCGGGRNLVYFLRQGYKVFAVDSDPDAILYVKELARMLAPSLPPENFTVDRLEGLMFPAAFADIAISNAVLHFAADEKQFCEMLEGTWRALKSGGLFFCRLASSIGQEQSVISIGKGRFLLPDGSERFLVDQPMLMRLTLNWRAELLDPLKTTVVQDQRSMTTWVLRKP